MTREEMIALANQAGMSNLSLIDIGYLEAFVNLILEAAAISLDETIAQQAEAIRLKDAALDWCIGEFNLRLDDIDLSQETIRVLSARHTQSSPEILQARDERVAEACKAACENERLGKIIGDSDQAYENAITHCSHAIDSKEWRKYL